MNAVTDMVLNNSWDAAAREELPNMGSGRAASSHSHRSWGVCGEEAYCSHFTLFAKPGSALQWKVPKSLNFYEETAALAFFFAHKPWDHCSSGLLWMVICLWLPSSLHIVLYKLGLFLLCLGWLCLFGGGFLLLCSSLWGRAGCPELRRVRLPLDVAEEVEQHSSEGFDSAFSSLANYRDPSNFLVCSIFSLFFFPFFFKREFAESQ